MAFVINVYPFPVRKISGDAIKGRVMRRRLPGGYKSAVLTLLVLLVGFLPAMEATAEITTLSESINKAGRQRMLTQRIVKAYCLVGMGVQSGRHKKQLRKAIALFESQLIELKAFAPNDNIKAGLAKVEQLWGPFKEIASGKPDKDGANQLLDINDALLAAANEVVGMLEMESGTDVGRLVNIAGRQRMLSQRLAKFYMARAWKLERPEVIDEMKSAASQFDDALMAELINAEANTSAIQDELNKAKKQWRVYKRGLALEKDSGDYIPVIMATTSENLLKIMNKITGMYADLPAR